MSNNRNFSSYFEEACSLENALAIDLQWFAAEDEGRTEEPSEYKIRKAREEGRVAKSQELIGALGLLLPTLTLIFLGPSMFKTSLEMIRFFFTRLNETDNLLNGTFFVVFLTYFARLALPIIAVAMLSGIIANLVQTGFLFTTKPLVPKFSKIVPRFGQYFQRTLFSVEGLFNFAKSIIKIVIIGVVSYIVISSKIQRLARLQTATLWTGFTTVAGLTAQLLIIAALLLLGLSIPDYLFQRWQYMESLKMTKQEVKEERKMYEGDPLIKSRLRQRMRELLSRNMAANVPKADVVITNPTHFAVALEWNKDTMPAPMVTAKGADEVAQRIKAIANEHGVPIVENKPLARALYAEVEIGDIIPETYYQAIATVLAHVYKINEERRKTAV
ncbi:MAG TPA: flagellar biosynthesis protein FlhB [Treponema sp.]|nr:flagellar biosynthesis protein FlhB [Treponema sp.]HPC70321.1 flagellar biosynthesis protein FlhB [Treponema sp.]HRS02803.1 flagellar biosynthesis protein FlhB [Treponema sp.]HRU27400.1 flagellar biosynthesis protein FlhB [Treponema sp.]